MQTESHPGTDICIIKIVSIIFILIKRHIYKLVNKRGPKQLSYMKENKCPYRTGDFYNYLPLNKNRKLILQKGVPIQHPIHVSENRIIYKVFSQHKISIPLQSLSDVFIFAQAVSIMLTKTIETKRSVLSSYLITQLPASGKPA